MLKGKLLLLLAGTVIMTGCAATQQTGAPVDAGVETVAFTTSAERVDVVDVATAVLVQHDFTITLANERLGLIQTDYSNVAGIEAMRADSGMAHPALNDLYMRLTVNSENRGDLRVVQVKGSFQRMAGGQAPDRLIGLYWMERLARDMAVALDADYTPRVSATTYEQALENASLPGAGDNNRAQLNRGLKAVGIVAAILFAATLAAGVFAPSGAQQ